MGENPSDVIGVRLTAAATFKIATRRRSRSGAGGGGAAGGAGQDAVHYLN